MEATVEAIVIPTVVFGALVLIVWLTGKVRLYRIEKQVELQQQLLTKFESAGELAEFLSTESGKQFMRQFDSKPHRGILITLSFGIVLSFVGLVLLGLIPFRAGDLYQGGIMLAFGLGLVAAAAVSRRLSVQWEKESRNGY